ncbi:hypothetical protein F5Y13DRAFT_15623 [Hypoxylon sp. FL1857]|nr:hypothetical protein F5Y13DRAFT_15623 [Hypoxylon sp. FL1857]
MALHTMEAQKPIQAKWSNTSIGPDGPWPAIEMMMGGVQDIALYPGGAIDRTYVIVKGYCTTGNTPCFASNAGLYNPGAGGDYNASNFSTPDIIYGDSVKGYSFT